MGFFTIASVVSTVVSLGISAYSAYKAKKNAKKLAKLSGRAKTKTIGNKNKINPADPNIAATVVYGRDKVDGVRVFDYVDKDQMVLHRALAFTGHEIDSFEHIFFNNKRVNTTSTVNNWTDVDTVVDLDLSTNAQYSTLSGTTAPVKTVPNNAYMYREHLGSPDQTYDPYMPTISGWSTSHRLREVSYLALKMTYNAKYHDGVPKVSAIIKGKKLYDPRNVLHDSNDTSTWEWSDNPALCILDYIGTDFFASGPTLNLDSVDVASFETAADICDEDIGGGVKRYTCNGSFELDDGTDPESVLQDLLMSMAGNLWYAQGKWRVKAGAYTSPVLDLTEDDFRTSVALSTKDSRSDTFNTLTGTYSGDASDYEKTDFPQISDQSLVEADNGIVLKEDIDLPFTSTSDEAVRIGTILLERSREQVSLTAGFSLKAIKVQVGDNVTLTHSRFGFNQKVFEVMSWSLVPSVEDMVVQLGLREISANVFNTVLDVDNIISNNSDLLDPNAQSGLQFTSITQFDFIANEQISKGLKASITATTPALVDSIEVQIRKSGETNYQSLGQATPNDSGVVLLEARGLETGSYETRARARNGRGVLGDFLDGPGVEVTSASVSDETIVGLEAQVVGSQITIDWEPSTDPALSYYQVRYSSTNDAGAFVGSWADSVKEVTKVARPATSVVVPAREGTYFLRTFNKEGTQGLKYSEINVNFVSALAGTTAMDQHTTFSGTKTNCQVVSGELQLTSTTGATTANPVTGTYAFATGITGLTSGDVFRASAVVVNRRVGSGASVNFDDLPGLYSSLDYDNEGNPVNFNDLGSSGTSAVADTEAQVYISLDNGTTWQLLRTSEYQKGSYDPLFKAVLSTTTEGVTPSLTRLSVKYKVL